MKDQLAKVLQADKPAIYEMHALWDGWENADLKQRRVLMAQVIKKRSERL